MAMAIPRPRGVNRKWVYLIAGVVVLGVLMVFVEDWHQLWKISSTPDNVPIVAMIPLVASIFMAVHFWRIRKDGGISGPAPVMLESEMKPVKR